MTSPLTPPRWQRWLARARWPTCLRWRRQWARVWNTPGGLMSALVTLLVLYGVWVFTGMQALVQAAWLSPR